MGKMLFVNHFVEMEFNSEQIDKLTTNLNWAKTSVDFYHLKTKSISNIW